MVRPSLDSPTAFINREESWLNFNWRVLEEAQDALNPLLERVKFLAISASNLDEFFEVRVAGLLQRIEEGFIDAGPDALSAQQERELIALETREFVQEQYECWNTKLIPALAKDRTPLSDQAYDGGIISAESLGRGQTIASNQGTLASGSENPAALAGPTPVTFASSVTSRPATSASEP